MSSVNVFALAFPFLYKSKRMDQKIINDVLRPKMKRPKKSPVNVLVIHDCLEETNGISQVLNNWPNIKPTIITVETYNWHHPLNNDYDIVIFGKNCITPEEAEFNKLLNSLARSRFLELISPESPEYQRQIADGVEKYLKTDGHIFPYCLKNKYPNAIFGSFSDSVIPNGFTHHCTGTKYISLNKTYEAKFIIFMNNLIEEVIK